MRHRPILTEPPNNLTAVVGENSTFRCTVLSDLHPHFVWIYHKDDDVSNGTAVTNDEDGVEVKVYPCLNVAWFECDRCMMLLL